MKPQTRKGALIETTVNLMVGFAISYALNFFLLPWWTGATPTTASLLGLGGAFTLASVVRQYVLRRVFERLRIRKAPPDFLYIMVEVADERTRQISGEGYTTDHDDRYRFGDLASAGAAYAKMGSHSDDLSRRRWLGAAEALWPWDRAAFKPTTARRDLVKACALIVAEIGRLDRRARRGAPR